MSLWTPPVAWGAMTSNVINEATISGTTVTAHATPHTKGSYSEVITSTPFDAYGVMVLMAGGSATGFDTSMLVDLAIGAAASEVVIIPNLAAGFSVPIGTGGGQRYWFPLFIPSGSRIAARSQAAITVDTVNITVWLFGKPSGPVWAGQKVTAYGANLTTSCGPTITTSTAGEGGWAEIVASTSDPIRHLSVGVQAAASAATTNSSGMVDLGVGAAASEVAVMEHYVYVTNTAEALLLMATAGWPLDIPSGSRLAARAEATSAVNIDAICYGVS